MFDFIPKRYVFVCVGFTATSLSVALQTNLSLSIVYMVNRTEQSSNYPRSFNESISVVSMNDSISEKAQKMIPTREVYDWNPELQGIVLGALYYGMILAYIPGGRFAEVYGGKRTIISSLLLASVFTTLLPIAARLSVYAFIVCRIIIGFGTAPVFPVLFYMLPRWIPTAERSFSASVLFAGYGTGAFVSLSTTGVLCSSNLLGGWPSVFYVNGLCGIFWCGSCFYVVTETPDDHPTIKTSEVEYIKNNIGDLERKQIEYIPWKSIATSVPVWSLAIGTFGQFWILGFYVTSQSLYMGSVLNLDSAQNGFMSCLPNLTRALFACVCGGLIDGVLRRRDVPIVFVRKGATLSNSIVACIGFIAILYVGYDPILNTVCFVIGGLMGDFLTFGVCLATVDIAPNLAGTLSGILSCVGNIPYFILPSLIGIFTKHESSMAQWRYVYYCTLGVIIVTTFIYIAFGTSDPQPWAVDDKEDLSRNKRKNHKSNQESGNNGVPKLKVFVCNTSQHI